MDASFCCGRLARLMPLYGQFGKYEMRKGLMSMKSEQFHDLNLKHADTILEAVAQLMELAEKLFCTVRAALDNVSVDQEIAWAN
jgi:hypothetical protein